jgi:hypothetical protein
LETGEKNISVNLNKQLIEMINNHREHPLIRLNAISFLIREKSEAYKLYLSIESILKDDKIEVMHKVTALFL